MSTLDERVQALETIIEVNLSALEARITALEKKETKRRKAAIKGLSDAVNINYVKECFLEKITNPETADDCLDDVEFVLYASYLSAQNGYKEKLDGWAEIYRRTKRIKQLLLFIHESTNLDLVQSNELLREYLKVMYQDKTVKPNINTFWIVTSDFSVNNNLPKIQQLKQVMHLPDESLD